MLEASAHGVFRLASQGLCLGLEVSLASICLETPGLGLSK